MRLPCVCSLATPERHGLKKLGMSLPSLHPCRSEPQASMRGQARMRDAVAIVRRLQRCDQAGRPVVAQLYLSGLPLKQRWLAACSQGKETTNPAQSSLHAQDGCVIPVCQKSLGLRRCTYLQCRT